jgi:hypothetical protein
MKGENDLSTCLVAAKRCMSSDSILIQASSTHPTISEKHLIHSNHAEIYVPQALSVAVASCHQIELN